MTGDRREQHPSLVRGLVRTDLVAAVLGDQALSEDYRGVDVTRPSGIITVRQLV